MTPCRLLRQVPKATDIWDKRYEGGEHVGSQATVVGDPVDYTQHKFLYRRAIAMPTTGSEDGWVVDVAGRRWMTPPAKRVLSIGCGMAFVEEHLLRAGYAEHILAYDMSRSAIEAARLRLANLAGRIDLQGGDVLNENLPDASFDVVFVQAAIHHFMDIEAMYRLMHRVLVPGGLLIFDEYIGPDHHIYDAHVMALMNEVDRCLAERYRYDHLAKHVRPGIPVPSLEWMMQHDPSEGVHASQIMPLTYRYFDVLDRRDYGGAVMRPFFTGILPNFDWQDPKDQTIARLIVLIEQLMTRHGVIPSYHSHVVARRREAVRPPLERSEAERITYADWPGLAAQQAKAGSNATSKPWWAR